MSKDKILARKVIKMIIEQKSNIKKLLPYVQGNLKKGLEFLAELDITTAKLGDYPIDGQKVYAKISEYNTLPREEKKAETHAKYIDIQFLISGEERVYTKPWQENLPIVEDLLETKDACFYQVQETESHVLAKETFAIYFPWEVHRPGCTVANTSCTVKKLVIKVLKE